jgi:hypothetical protein
VCYAPVLNTHDVCLLVYLFACHTLDGFLNLIFMSITTCSEGSAKLVTNKQACERKLVATYKYVLQFGVSN